MTDGAENGRQGTVIDNDDDTERVHAGLEGRRTGPVGSAGRLLPHGDGAALSQRTLDRVLAAFRAAGVPTDRGYDLGRVFRGAGLGTPTMTVGGHWEDGPDGVGYGLLAGITRTLLPVMTVHHIATSAEVDIDTLEDRLRAASHDGSGVMAPLLVSAWARTSV